MTRNANVKRNEQTRPAYDTAARILILANHLTGERNDWKQLEKTTGLSATKWRHVHAGVTRPSLEMLDALCRAFPQYAFWLATGISDETTGHLSPIRALAFPGDIDPTHADLKPTPTGYFHSCQTTLTELSAQIITSTLENTDEFSDQNSNYLNIIRKIEFSPSNSHTQNAIANNVAGIFNLLDEKENYLRQVVSNAREIEGIDQFIDEQRKAEEDFTKRWKKD